MSQSALLVLEDGRSFRGEAFGALGETFGEAVFSTGMSGYQETLTDPSYHRQVVVMTAPHVGNTGMNDEDRESRRIWVNGYVVRDPARVPSNWRSTRSLDDELRDQGVVGISGVDTRALTRHLRDRGAMRVGITSEHTDADALLAQVVVMCAPHVGNTGVNDEDRESSRIWVSGYVVRDPARRTSSWRARRGLGDELSDQGVVGISGVDTRALTRHLRERGAMRSASPAPRPTRPPCWSGCSPPTR